MSIRHQSVLAVAWSLVLVAHAAAAQGKGKSGVQVSGNAALVSDYVFRGLSQTWGQPALQGGVDVDAGRWHVGAWTSNVSRNSYPGGGMELDLFGDVGLFAHGDWSARAGLYGYFYPGANLDHARPALGSRSLDTVEANLALTWRAWTLKYSRALTDYFGADVEQGYTGSTRGTQYLQIDGAIPLAKDWSLQPHAGYTDYAAGVRTPLPGGARDPSYADFGIALKFAPSQRFAASLGVTHATNAAFYRHATSFLGASGQKDVGGTRVVLSLSTTF
ncbi:MAG: TorF family putative porin [Xanthomonadaceae bacterium]|nr:TorF family putative porin [Xanthomonadaceae bacterium]